ncbi:hypothetical protein BDF20DRAFT_837126 [Mycotypha africana]|uniref:uncharacterized protein n=1 Tax=Mycotypha africana TaxID=64632 RepID=UPI0022FFDE8F|nr:uncharacterized protein BDF20DRAFT_837126 [Mycotypha africana]KAI8975779.1 hypothetical protein BDF20DRAFT_837126 [Mycotypha africana]
MATSPGVQKSPYTSLKKLYPSISTLNLASTLAYSTDQHDSSMAAVAETQQKNLEPPPEFAFDLPKRNLVLDRIFATKKVQPIPSMSSLGEQQHQQQADTLEAFFVNATQNSPNAIKPVQQLIERLTTCQQLSKHLLDYFKMLADMEQQVSKVYHTSGVESVRTGLSNASSLDASSNRMSLPSSEGNRKKSTSFMSSAHKISDDSSMCSMHTGRGEHVNSIIEAWKHYHNKASEDHVQFAAYLKSQAIPTFENINRELKWMMKCISKDDRLSLKTLTKLKYEAAKRIKALNQQILFFEEHPYYGHTRQDPWLMNAGVVDQLVKVYRQENKIHETVLRVQQETWAAEQHFISEFERLTQQLYALRQDNGLIYITELWNSSHKRKGSHHEGGELDRQSSIDVTPQHYNIISDKASFRHPDQIQLAHPLLQPILATRMDGKSRALFTTRWLDCIYVLTAAGFLHEYQRSENYPSNPDATIYVPHYTVIIISTFTNPHHQSLMFQLQPKMISAKPAMTNTLSLTNKQWKATTKSRWNHHYQDRKTWTLRAKSMKEMEEWVANLRKCSEKLFAQHISVSPSSSTINTSNNLPTSFTAAEQDDSSATDDEAGKRETTLKEDIGKFKEEDITKNGWITSNSDNAVAAAPSAETGSSWIIPTNKGNEEASEAVSNLKETGNKWVHTAEVTMTGWD